MTSETERPIAENTANNSQEDEKAEDPERPSLGKEEKSRRLWIFLAVFLSLCALALGLAIAFSFTKEEDSQVAIENGEDLIVIGGPDEQVTNDASPSPTPIIPSFRTNSPVVSLFKTRPPTLAPVENSASTAGPAAVASDTELQTRIRLVLEANVPNAEELNDQSKPQYAALQWLTSTNTLPLEQDWKIVQRYSLVTTLTALNGQLSLIGAGTR